MTNPSSTMQDLPFAEWQQYALTAIGHILIDKGYFESRFAKITLAQKLLHRNIETRLIPLGSHSGRTAFLKKLYDKHGPVKIQFMRVDHSKHIYFWCKTMKDGVEVRPKMELPPIIWATAMDCHLFLTGIRFYQQREAAALSMASSASNGNRKAATKTPEEKTSDAEGKVKIEPEDDSDWTTVLEDSEEKANTQ
ncbi:hypothetical protein MMC22_011459 [Lobaria immixta]|nr:hypothetical protein [Lobaria immixta]